jgi:hypothetical protein
MVAGKDAVRKDNGSVRSSIARFDHVEEQGHGHGWAEDSHQGYKH